jgi:hypothetical protein
MDWQLSSSDLSCAVRPDGVKTDESLQINVFVLIFKLTLLFEGYDCGLMLPVSKKFCKNMFNALPRQHLYYTGVTFVHGLMLA